MFSNKPNREFQSGLKTEERRRSRQDDRLKLRRADRENRLKSKRQAFSNRTRNYNNDYNDNSNNQHQKMTKQKRAEMLKHLPQFVKGCFTDHPATQFECTQRIRKLLSLESNPPIIEVIQSGVVPRLIQFLHFNNMPRLQFEAAWALTNIASGTAENTAQVIRHGAVPLFVQLLRSPNDEVKEQAIWALGNIAGDSPECRNLVLSHGALEGLLPICHTNITTQQQATLLRNATWTLSNFCRGKPQPEWKYVKVALQALVIMITSDDDEILQDACWAYSYLSDCEQNFENQQIDAIRKSGGMQKLVELLQHPSPHVRHPALRTIGNIVTGDDNQTQYVINMGVLKHLQSLLNDSRPPIKREACWTISNVTAGSKDQIEAVINGNLIPGLIAILRNEKYEIAKEALWAISNATSGGTDQQIMFLVHQGVIPPLCNYLRTDYGHNNNKAMLVALEGIENILKVGVRRSSNGINQMAQHVEECGGTDYLEKLQSDQSIPDNIYEKAAQIIQEYFGGEETTFGAGNDNMNTFGGGSNDNTFGGGNNNNNNNNNNNQQNQSYQTNGNNNFAFGANHFNTNNNNNNSDNNNAFGNNNNVPFKF